MPLCGGCHRERWLSRDGEGLRLGRAAEGVGGHPAPLGPVWGQPVVLSHLSLSIFFNCLLDMTSWRSTGISNLNKQKAGIFLQTVASPPQASLSQEGSPGHLLSRSKPWQAASAPCPHPPQSHQPGRPGWAPPLGHSHMCVGSGGSQGPVHEGLSFPLGAGGRQGPERPLRLGTSRVSGQLPHGVITLSGLGLRTVHAALDWGTELKVP